MPYLVVRSVGGTLMLLSHLLMLYNVISILRPEKAVVTK